MEDLEDLAEDLKVNGCKGCWGGARVGVGIGIGWWYGHGGEAADTSDSKRGNGWCGG